jgi:acetate kinase
MNVLVLNSGSSSQKSALFELESSSPDDAIAPLWEAKIEWNDSAALLDIRNNQGAKVHQQVEAKDRKSATEQMLSTLWDGPASVLNSSSGLAVVGHRVVHGGPKFNAPTLITPEVKKTIASLSSFAPLHNRAELDGIEMIEQLAPQIPQVAVFDTGFHRTLPPEAFTYPGPYEWLEQGIRRYGFHGINHEYCAHRAARLLNRDIAALKIVTCHLGNGCSLAAIADGKSIDTTMGFTPLEGLMMGTRSGSVDPGILTYLLRENAAFGKGEDLDDLLNKKSGLLGVSGLSSDMREIVSVMRSGNQRAKLAFDIFIHRLQKEIAAMAASLSGLDVLVFTAGIGENSPEARSACCSKLGFFGLELDEAKNRRSPRDQEISSADSAIRILVIRAQEDWAIARSCVRLLGAHGAAK